jgi:hypothetical protein
MAEEQQTFTFYEGDETTESPSFEYLANQEGYKKATVEELREYYEEAINLQKTFGDFENYLAYMTERESLIQSGEYDPGTYGEIVDTGMVQNVDGTMIDPSDIQNLSRNDFISKYGLDPSEVQIVKQETGADRAAGYRDWLGSDSVQKLNQKYGIPDVRQTDDGREYMWNGSAWVKTKEPENFDFGDALKLATAVGFGAVTGTALGGVLGSSGAVTQSIASGLGIAPSTVGAAAGGMLSSSISQYILTGEIDPTQVFVSGLTAVILDAADVMGAGNYSDVSADAFNTATSGPLATINEKVWDLADALGTDFNTALDIVKGVTVGAIEGGDLEGIVIGAATTIGADKLTSYIEDSVGLAVPNFFEEGTTEISRDAVNEMSRIFLRDTLEGNIDEGTLASMGLGYLREGGTLSFADPSELIPDIDTGKVGDFFDFLPDIELMGGEGFDIDIDTDEARMEQALSELSSEDIEQGKELDPKANIILQYDQGTVDEIEQVLRDAKEAGSEFNEEVIKPVVDVIQEAGYAVDDYILQPIKEGIMSIWDMLPSLPETDVDLPSISGIDIDLPDVEFKGSKPFGEDLKAFRPLTAPQMGQQAPLLPKVDVQGFDPRRTGSPIVASLFSEYLG